MIDYAIDTLIFTALLVVLTVLVRSVHAGYQMAGIVIFLDDQEAGGDL